MANVSIPSDRLTSQQPFLLRRRSQLQRDSQLVGTSQWWLVAAAAWVRWAAAYRLTEDEAARPGAGTLALLLIVGLLVAMVVRRWRVPRWSNMTLPVVALAAIAFGLIAEAWHRQQGAGHANEGVMVLLLSNVAIGLAVLAPQRRPQGLAGFTATFAVVFCTALDKSGPSIVRAELAGGLLLVIWLAAWHWDGLSPPADVRRVDRIKRWGLIAMLFVPLAVSIGLWTPAGRKFQALVGFMPTSGGREGWGDRNARDGIGDGDQLIAAKKQINAVGALREGPMVDDKRPSLYDVISEEYGDPVKRERTERAISLPREMEVELERRVAKHDIVSRQFDTARESGEDQPKLADKSTDAVMYWEGRLPVHMALETYDVFDGWTWTPIPDDENLPLTHWHEKDNHWVGRFQSIDPERSERGTVTISQLKANVIPSMSRLDGVSIANVHDASLFAWRSSHLMLMRRDSVPESVPIMQQWRFPADDLSIPPYPPDVSDPLRTNPGGPLGKRIESLAQQWAQGATTDWDRVLQIVEGVRGSMTFDARARYQGTASMTPIEQALDAKRGASYHFATVAALALRSMGYRTRMITGFYGRPERLDGSLGTAQILAEDAHGWLEVDGGRYGWIPLEPTPDHQLLKPRMTLRRAARLATIALWRTIVRFPLTTVAIAIATVAIVAFRRRLFDRLVNIVYRLQSRWRHDEGALAMATIRMLDRRARSSGLRRSSGTTPSRHLRQIAEAIHPSIRDRIDCVILAAQQAAYLPAHRVAGPAANPAPAATDASVRQACRSLDRSLRFGVLAKRGRSIRRLQKGTQRASQLRKLDQALVH
jgi:protein-glutamine gamma-glutamyltransferase